MCSIIDLEMGMGCRIPLEFLTSLLFVFQAVSLRGTDARCLYGDAANCSFQCHCLHDTECGGPCPTGCDTAALGYNWRGQACQIDPEQPMMPELLLIKSNETEFLKVTNQNIFGVVANCDSISTGWLVISINGTMNEIIPVYANTTAYILELMEYGVYKAWITIENNEGFQSTTEVSIFNHVAGQAESKNNSTLVTMLSVIIVGVLIIIAVSLAVVCIITKRRRERLHKKLSVVADEFNFGRKVNITSDLTKDDATKARDLPQTKVHSEDDLVVTEHDVTQHRYENHAFMKMEHGKTKQETPKTDQVINKDHSITHNSTENDIDKEDLNKNTLTQDGDISTKNDIVSTETGRRLEDEHVYGNACMSFIKPEPVKVADFEDYVNERKSKMNDLIAEYQSLPKDDSAKCTIGLAGKNKAKNRYRNIYPYDNTIVKLTMEHNAAMCEYINANYITGFNRENEYIATQGPKDVTVGEFWRMIWQEEANRIIMVANVEENGKLRSYPYWSEDIGSSVTQGLFNVTTDGLEVCADYTIRMLTLRKRNESRTVRHFHFTSWEDKNKPLYGATTLLTFVRKVHAFDQVSKGPMVVHCSAGVGRTGTFIALDILQQEATRYRIIDVYRCVEKLRGERMSMVQTKDQYIFLHDAMAEYIKCGDTSYSCTGFTKTLSKLCGDGSEYETETELAKQFMILSDMKKIPVSEDKDGLESIHVNKNRDLSIIPDDGDRPYLPGGATDNYMNAVFADSFKVHNYYVVTQMPLPGTIADFWRLVFSQKSQSIVMLNQIQEGDETCQPYWPTEEKPKQKYGPIEVTLVTTNDGNTLDSIVTRDIIVKDKSRKIEDELVVRQFQLLTWPNSDPIPSKKEDLLGLFTLLLDWQQQHTNTSRAGNTIVHCMTGGLQSGVFCGVSHTLDKMKVDQEIDAFLAVRSVTRRRPQFFKTLPEYKYLYEMAIQCMSQYDNYANFR